MSLPSPHQTGLTLSLCPHAPPSTPSDRANIIYMYFPQPQQTGRTFSIICKNIPPPPHQKRQTLSHMPLPSPTELIGVTQLLPNY